MQGDPTPGNFSIVLRPQTHSFSLAREHTRDILQAAFPSHPTTQHPSGTARICAQFFLRPTLARVYLSEAFYIHPRSEQVSLVPPPKPPSPHHSWWTASLHTLARGTRDFTAAKTCQPPHPTLKLPRYWACKESLSPTNILTWSWHEPTGDHLAAPAAEHSGARVPGYLQTLPAKQLMEKDLSAFCKCQKATATASALHVAKNILLHVATCRELTHPKEGTTSWGNALVPHRGCSSLPASQTNIKTTCS